MRINSEAKNHDQTLQCIFSFVPSQLQVHAQYVYVYALSPPNSGLMIIIVDNLLYPNQTLYLAIHIESLTNYIS